MAVNGICYLKELSKWESVYYYYRKRFSLECFDLLLERLCGHVLVICGQKAKFGVDIIDSQSTKWGNNHSLNGVDDNKEVKGVKRHIIVDKNGFLIAVMVTIANIHDRALKIFCVNVNYGIQNEFRNFFI